jgi:hypothetical protein
MTESSNVIGKLSVQYSHRPVLKALLKLVPGWSAADTLLQKRADEIKSDRLKVFFDELAQGKRELTDELIQSDSFLHAYFCTLRAAMNSRQHEKIQNFARLLDSSLDPALHVSEDEHEELLTLLEEITLREFAVLRDLRNRELAHPRRERENALQHARRYWKDFRSATVEAYGVPDESFNAFMARLERTGLYLRITGNYLDYAGDVGATTPLLARVIALVGKT